MSTKAKKRVNRALREGAFNPTRIGRAFPKVGSPSFYEPLPDTSPVRSHRRALRSSMLVAVLPAGGLGMKGGER